MTSSLNELRLPERLGRLRRTYESGRTRPPGWRRDQLSALKRMLLEGEQALLDALHTDLGRAPTESWAAELGLVGSELDHTLKHLDRWIEPEKVSTPLINKPADARIRREPLGVVLIIGPWNYPFQLTVGPLVAALAAGNCALVKPSELAPATSSVVAELLPRYVEEDAVCVVEGGVEVSTELLKQRFDHIFYTGGAAVGRIVMRSAAEHLTPVTLELGGKSPCFVDAGVDLSTTARRIVWGKFLNAGQTCVAPDYLLVQEKLTQPLLGQLRKALRAFYGSDPKSSPDYARIINGRHFDRLQGLMAGGRVAIGGESCPEERYIAPTVLTEVDLESPVMSEEIFGPLLPMVPVADVREAIGFINERPKPLALYLFSKDARAQQRVVEETSSGGVCVNDTIMHLACPELPFGGVGPSGMGAYHGRAGFETFSHRKSVLTKGMMLDPSVRYPPYDPSKLKWIKRVF